MRAGRRKKTTLLLRAAGVADKKKKKKSESFSNVILFPLSLSVPFSTGPSSASHSPSPWLCTLLCPVYLQGELRRIRARERERRRNFFSEKATKTVERRRFPLFFFFWGKKTGKKTVPFPFNGISLLVAIPDHPEAQASLPRDLFCGGSVERERGLFGLRDGFFWGGRGEA